MNCDKVRKLFMDYVDNNMNNSDREKIESHISTCSECRTEMENLAGVSEKLRQAFQTATASVSPSPNAWLNIKNQVHNTHPSPGFWERIRARLETPQPIWQTGLVGVLAVIVICLVWLVPPSLQRNGNAGDAVSIARNNPEVQALISDNPTDIQTAQISDAAGNTFYRVTFVHSTTSAELNAQKTDSRSTEGVYSSAFIDTLNSASQFNYLVNAIVDTKNSRVVNVSQEYVPILSDYQKQLAGDIARTDPRIGNNATVEGVTALPVTLTTTSQGNAQLVVTVSLKVDGKSCLVTVDLSSQKVLSVK